MTRYPTTLTRDLMRRFALIWREAMAGGDLSGAHDALYMAVWVREMTRTRR